MKTLEVDTYNVDREVMVILGQEYPVVWVATRTFTLPNRQIVEDEFSVTLGFQYEGDWYYASDLSPIVGASNLDEYTEVLDSATTEDLKKAAQAYVEEQYNPLEDDRQLENIVKAEPVSLFAAIARYNFNKKNEDQSYLHTHIHSDFGCFLLPIILYILTIEYRLCIIRSRDLVVC